MSSKVSLSCLSNCLCSSQLLVHNMLQTAKLSHLFHTGPKPYKATTHALFSYAHSILTELYWTSIVAGKEAPGNAFNCKHHGRNRAKPPPKGLSEGGSLDRLCHLKQRLGKRLPQPVMTGSLQCILLAFPSTCVHIPQVYVDWLP